MTLDYKVQQDERSDTRMGTYVEREVELTTIRAYIYNLAKFLSYLEATKATHNTPGMHASSSCSEKVVNFYLNEILSDELTKAASIEAHRSALVAYYNWLDSVGLKSRLSLRTYRTTRQIVAEKSDRQQYIQYVTKSGRNKLLAACTTISEKLMMRMGYEVGLRTAELVGLRLSGKGGLAELFPKLDNAKFDHHDEFSYLLKGKYTKGKTSRWIYLSRDLLLEMRRYVESERAAILKMANRTEDCFFVRRDPGNVGMPIGREQASRVFRKRAMIAGLNKLLSFHDLRHTFATELFHYEITRNFGRETRSESAALIVVAQRLGHKFTKDGHAPATTTRYIRMRLQMLELEL
ncbi:tyrosine-type recombinase/integrase [Cellvibrio sp. PSBB023]|uniref:tyrosine-type recombinase/integrase n=1 Tax=Cellvibrio sp. PSBB023 TaxID=1945512 RepID=UPI00143C78B1|nr:tyrosine-type recombinase/integrase [Cellvibrio sp. PSBB023]